ncbi:MAG TPA: HD domain-containing phosphohydrolase [Polyangiaceae bacterium]|nr:HD domain-containing phosphohydrolase [Polyangiaceae bacterium]
METTDLETALGSASLGGPSASDPISRCSTILRRDPRQAHAIVTRPHPLICMVRRESRVVLLTAAPAWDHGRDVFRPFAPRFADGQAMLVILGRPRDPDLQVALNKGLSSLLGEAPTSDELFVALHNAFELMEMKSRAESRGKWLNRYRYELGELIECARAIETERDIDRLLGLILEKSRFITGADAGSIYVVEPDARGEQVLRFKLSQNDSVRFDSREFTIPLNTRSMSGAAALHAKPINIVDVYDMPLGSPFGFDRSFDAKIGYRTQSVLCMPLVSRNSEVIGVIQLINKKRDKEKRLYSKEDVTEQVVAFDERSQELVGTLAAQAGISLENAMLLEEIRRIFEGFVNASVEAIESRDPTTSGHSRRVADLTLGLAKAVERVEAGPYREVVFSKEDLREIEYASLLHDFGKIGVKEQVLVKAKKLYDPELELIRQRIEFAVRSLEVDVLTRKIGCYEQKAPLRDLEALDRELALRRAELLDAWQAIESANEPTVLKGGEFSKIEALAKQSYATLAGDYRPLLSPAEVTSLSVTRGSLTPGEIEEIRSHVSHTYNFLSTIPWGKSFRRVPIIAGAHHEKLNGTGYPNRLRAEEIPLQSKLMSISDVFDALTASDRPYKRAVPVDKALDILGFEVKDKHLDGDLVKIFCEARVWEPVMGSSPGPRSMR